jgi:pyruvate dehydrogenase E1 component alpha subunit
MNVLDVYEKAGAAVKKARDGGGPTLLECKTYRYMAHSRFEKSNYRTQEELEIWKKRDPIPAFAALLQARWSVSPRELEEAEEQAGRVIEDSVRFAEESPDPMAGDYEKYIFA